MCEQSHGKDYRMAKGVKLTPLEWGEKWQRRLSAAGADMERGVNRVSENPAQKAIDNQDKMRARVLESIDNGKWARGLSRVTLTDWKKAMIEKGIPRVSQGAQSARPKVQAFAAELTTHIEAGQAALDNLPDLTIEDSINRVSQWIRHMHEFRRGG